MPVEIKMPQLSDTMDSGKILNWHKNEGDVVSRGDILAEVETDKANLEIESFHQGTLLKIVTGVEETADVGQIIAYIGEPGEEVPAASAASGASSTTTSEPAPADAPATAASGATVATPQNGSNGAPPSGRIKASPVAKKIAAQKNIDLSSIQGSGPDGRIVKRDVEGHSAPTPAASQAASPAQAPPSVSTSAPRPAPAAPVAHSGTESTTPMSKMRETIARRMQQSVAEAPHFYVTTSIDMGEALKLRQTFKEEPGYEKVNINHMIIKATAYAIAREPRVNRSVRDETSVYDPGQINIGIITAIEDGLLIPVIRSADALSLKDIAFEARAAVDRARAGRPNSTDLTGGTFSISNMGMFDVENFTAIINPGQGSVLAVSSIVEQPVVKNGQIITGHLMKVTVSVDHRIIDGIMAGNFLKYLKQGLETPALLMM